MPFKQSRIMTFGYNSTLVDKRAVNDRLQDYADSLLTQIRLLRSAAEQARPLIFICHSMGGLVARLAMTRLHTLPEKFGSLKPKQCGLLFLSTPHLGSQASDWGNFVPALGEVVGVRGTLVRELKSFNPSSVDATEIFKSMKLTDRPVFECLCEGQQTFAGGKNRLVCNTLIRP